MSDKHLSSQFGAELANISSRVLEMGGQVESQLAQAMYALMHMSEETAVQVLQQEERIDQMEVEIDHDLSAIIARRQPTARDLRLLISVSRCTADLERVGDEAARIARVVQRVARAGMPNWLRIPLNDLQYESQLALALLRKSLDAFARLDAQTALEVLRQDDAIDQEFDGLLRKLITYMMEDPRTISASIDLVFVAKALERVGDHAKNIAESIIYIVKGTDVRHSSLEAVQVAVGAR